MRTPLNWCFGGDYPRSSRLPRGTPGIRARFPNVPENGGHWATNRRPRGPGECRAGGTVPYTSFRGRTDSGDAAKPVKPATAPGGPPVPGENQTRRPAPDGEQDGDVKPER
ncbi:hypothetical protein GCM10009546_24920 [Actinomadura livida]|uniref:Uncharacterized protein n=1 Tax=Actinomadura livida TaxID=79909 RepID=A0ABN1E974_9ACTN|nr:hypothetical protein GCM10010208_38940 [Actinomadura livida]